MSSFNFCNNMQAMERHLLTPIVNMRSELYAGLEATQESTATMTRKPPQLDISRPAYQSANDGHIEPSTRYLVQGCRHSHLSANVGEHVAGSGPWLQR